jgi:type II secretory pathway pseudopilin PulG
MNYPRYRPGFTIVELLAAVLAVGLLLAAILPSIARAQGSSGIQQSMNNLATMGVAQVLYALDWEGRQVTWVRDDLGAYGGDVEVYNAEVCGGCTCLCPPPCQPAAVAGVGCDGNVWAYWPGAANRPMLQPLNFPGPPHESSLIDGYGNWRVPNLKSLHDYVNGRYHDPLFYAPGDTVILGHVTNCIGEPCEFVGGDYDAYGFCNPGWSSYAFSAAAMFHPDVFRSNAAGGWQAPWTLDHGYESPGLFQAAYPQLKTNLLEHNWFRNAPAECNPIFNPSCEPYWFNQGIDASPVTLFYDGSVRLLPNAEVLAADQQVLDQTGGQDGLWHRGTTFGDDGYFISAGYDGTPLSHHVLTTDGILGRDTLSGPLPLSAPARHLRNRAPLSFQPHRPPARTIDWSALVLTSDGDQP